MKKSVVLALVILLALSITINILQYRKDIEPNPYSDEDGRLVRYRDSFEVLY
jgi:hypothetical protein